MPPESRPPAPQSATKVPEELVEQLHGATQRFHEARKAVETEMAGTEYRHQERVDIATEKLREAEKEAEDVAAQIQQKLHTQPEILTTPPKKDG